MQSRMFAFPLHEVSYIRMTLKSDGESSITAREAVQKEWAGDSKNFRRQSFPQERLENDHVLLEHLRQQSLVLERAKPPLALRGTLVSG